MSFYVSTTISMLLTLLCGLFSLETASLVTVGWVAGKVKPNLAIYISIEQLSLVFGGGERKAGMANDK